MTLQQALELIDKEIDNYYYDEEVEKALVIYRKMKQEQAALRRAKERRKPGEWQMHADPAGEPGEPGIV